MCIDLPVVARYSLLIPSLYRVTSYRSLLTGDAWAVIFSVFAEGIKPPPIFYIALAITLSGVIIYETAPSPVINTQQEDIGDLQLTENDSTRRRDQSVRDGLVLT